MKEDKRKIVMEAVVYYYELSGEVCIGVYGVEGTDDLCKQIGEFIEGLMERKESD